MRAKTSEDAIQLGGSHHMAMSLAAAEKLAVGVCSQTICSSGFGLVSQLEDFLMEVSLRGATHGTRTAGAVWHPTLPKKRHGQRSGHLLSVGPVSRQTKYGSESFQYFSLLPCGALMLLSPC